MHKPFLGVNLILKTNAAEKLCHRIHVPAHPLMPPRVSLL